MLRRLEQVNETMADETGFYPEDLKDKVNCADPDLWVHVYKEAEIRPNKSGRLYRSRVLKLIRYVERRLGFGRGRRPYTAGSSRETTGPAAGLSARNRAVFVHHRQQAEEQMESEEPTPFLAFYNLSRCVLQTALTSLCPSVFVFD